MFYLYYYLILIGSSCAALSQRIKDIEFKFSDLAEGLFTHLQNNRIKVEKLTSKIANLPRSIGIYVYPMWEKVCRKINGEDTLVSLFTILNMEIWNILDYNLLEYFILKNGNPLLKSTMKDYIVELDIFKKETLVVQFIDCWEGHNRDIPTYEEVLFTFKKHTLTLAKLDAFRRQLMMKCFPSLSDFSGWIYYKYFKLGCFEVCWMLPEQLALLLREQINSIFNVLEEYQVAQVILRETTIYCSHNPLVGGKHQLSTT